MGLMLALETLSAEATHRCNHYQRDINYWQKEYMIKVRKIRELEKEITEAKMRLLKKGIKVPNIILNEICINTPRAIRCFER